MVIEKQPKNMSKLWIIVFFRIIAPSVSFHNHASEVAVAPPPPIHFPSPETARASPRRLAEVFPKAGSTFK